MEDAIVANITGTGSIADTSFPVQLNLFTSPPATPIQVTTATNAGIENPSLIPAPNAPCINYPVDVSSVILSNGSGTLSFDLEVSAMYPDLFSPSAAWNMIVAAATVFDPNYIPEDPYLVQEDYVYEKAELVVTYGGPIVPVPTLSEWSMILLMLFLAGFAATRLKQA